ncbi:MAG TPA: hypothetical protein VGF99_10955, partial [Myxococcota bacterium]
MLLPVLFAAFVVVQAPSPPTREAPRLLVLDLEANNLEEKDARAIDAVVLDSARVEGVLLVSQ